MRSRLRALCCVTVAAAIVAAGCTREAPFHIPTGPVPGPAPAPRIQIMGLVIGHDGPGHGSPQSAMISGWTEGDPGGSLGAATATNANGSFSIDVVADVRAIRFRAEAPGFVQPCLATLRITGTSTSYSIEIHLVRESSVSQLRTYSFVRNRIVEGLVFEATPAGRRGVNAASIIVDGSLGLGTTLADTLTDDQGRFALCGFDGETTIVLFAVKAGYELAEVALPADPATPLEIELKR